jgi:hypothetical protein
LQESLIDVTPGPILLGFERLDKWVTGRVEMLGRVLILGAIATADVTADQTHAQMHPRIPTLQTFLAPI